MQTTLSQVDAIINDLTAVCVKHQITLVAGGGQAAHIRFQPIASESMELEALWPYVTSEFGGISPSGALAKPNMALPDVPKPKKTGKTRSEPTGIYKKASKAPKKTGL